MTAIFVVSANRLHRIMLVAAQWVVSMGLLLLVWTLLVDRHVSHVFVASPEAAFRQIGSWISDGTATSMVARTSYEGASGLVVGLIVGILLSAISFFSPSSVGKIVEPMVAAVYAMPKYALLPMIFLWFGSGASAIMGFVAINIMPIFFLASMTGFRSVDAETIRMLKMLGASQRQITQKLLLRSAAGYLASAGTFAAPHAITTAIGGEMVLGATAGIGTVLDYGSQTINPAIVVGAMLVGTFVAAIAKIVGEWLGRRLGASTSGT